MTSDIRQLIRSYLDHIEDRDDYLLSVIERDVPLVADLAIEMINSSDATEVWETLLFVIDGARARASFNDYLRHSRLTATVAEGIYRKQWNLRANCIYALGKFGYHEHATILERALPHYIEHDPLLLPRVISELSWVARGDRLYVDLHRAVSSPLYLSRWAALAVTGHHGFDPDESGRMYGKRRARLLQRLANDEYPYVRIEAAHQLAELELLWQRGTLSRTELRQRSREWRRSEPDATFGNLEVWFTNYLSLMGYQDYTISQMDTFVDFIFRQPRPETYEDGVAQFQTFDAIWRETGEPAR